MSDDSGEVRVEVGTQPAREAERPPAHGSGAGVDVVARDKLRFAQRPTSADLALQRAHERRRPLPTVRELREAGEGDPGEVLARLTKSGEVTDRHLAAFLTVGGFLTAVSGAPLAAAVGHSGLFFPAVLLALGAVLAGLRGITRRLEAAPGMPVDWDDVTVARDGLAAKKAWSWLSARLLRASAYWLVMLTVILWLLNL